MLKMWILVNSILLHRLVTKKMLKLSKLHFIDCFQKQFCSLINVRQVINLKAKYLIFKKTFSKIPKVPLPLKTWLPEQNMALKTWLPEQNMSLKYWYQNRMWLSNIGTGTKTGQTSFCSGTHFESHILFRYQFLRDIGKNIDVSICLKII